MPIFDTPYGRLDAPSLEAAQKYIAAQRGAAGPSQAGPSQAKPPEGMWQRLMHGIGMPDAMPHPDRSWRGLLQGLESAGKSTLEEGLPTALSAIGGAGPASAIGRIALGAGTGAIAGAAQPGTAGERLRHAAMG